MKGFVVYLQYTSTLLGYFCFLISTEMECVPRFRRGIVYLVAKRSKFSKPAQRPTTPTLQADELRSQRQCTDKDKPL